VRFDVHRCIQFVGYTICRVSKRTRTQHHTNQETMAEEKLQKPRPRVDSAAQHDDDSGDSSISDGVPLTLDDEGQCTSCGSFRCKCFASDIAAQLQHLQIQETKLEVDTSEMQRLRKELSQQPNEKKFQFGDRVKNVDKRWKGKVATFYDDEGKAYIHEGRFGVVVGTTLKFVYIVVDGEKDYIKKGNNNVVIYN
jgi:hypothetical protein